MSADVELCEWQDPQASATRTTRCRFGRVAGTSHWSPVMLPEGMGAGAERGPAVWKSAGARGRRRMDDRINTSLTYGFVFDMCGIEIDPITYQVKVDRYVTMHDAGKLLNPLIANGQNLRRLRARHRRRALRRVRHQRRGRVPDRHLRRLPGADRERSAAGRIAAHGVALRRSRPLGAKGLAEGNCMSVAGRDRQCDCRRNSEVSKREAAGRRRGASHAADDAERGPKNGATR